MKAIVITQTEQQVKELHEKYWGSFNNVGYWGNPIQNFYTDWVWTINGKELSGSSGYRTLESTIERCPGYKIYYFNEFKKILDAN